MQRFKDKVALITGAASGIGRATAVRLASEGASVLCVDMQEGGLKETAKMINDASTTTGGKAEIQLCNVTDEAQVAETLARCISLFGQLDCTINMAGILRFDKFDEIKLADFERILNVNVTGTFLVCRDSIPHLLKTKGNIVNAASTSAHSGLPWGTVYSASKGAVLAMTKSIAIEYCKEGLRANTVSPGDIISGMSSPDLPKDVDMSLMARCMSPTGRREPDVIASTIALLASEDGKHITGEDIRVDGGTLS